MWCGAWIVALRRTVEVFRSPTITFLEVDERSAALHAELIDLREWVEALQIEVDDAGSRLSALQLEHVELNDEVEAISVAVRLEQSRKDNLQRELQRVKDECLAILILAEAGGPDRAEDTSFQAIQSMTQELQDQRFKFLEDIEVQYGRANVIAADCDSKSAEIFQFTAEILDASQRDKMTFTALESEISALELDQNTFEQSLSDCQSSLDSCQHSIVERSRSLQQELDTISQEEAALLLECEALDAEESLLKNELQELDLVAQESSRVDDQLHAREQAGESMGALEIMNTTKAFVTSLEDDVHSSRLNEAHSLTRRNQARSSLQGLQDASDVSHLTKPTSEGGDNDEDEIRQLSEKIRRQLGSPVTI